MDERCSVVHDGVLLLGMRPATAPGSAPAVFGRLAPQTLSRRYCLLIAKEVAKEPWSGSCETGDGHQLLDGGMMTEVLRIVATQPLAQYYRLSRQLVVD